MPATDQIRAAPHRNFCEMWNSLIDTGGEGAQIPAPYMFREKELRGLLGLAGTQPERHVIRTRLDSFYQHAAAETDAPEAHCLAATIEVVATGLHGGPPSRQASSPDTRNARSEGYNHLAKR